MNSPTAAQRLAEERETALLVHQHYLASAFEAGQLKARREGVRSMCELLGIEIDEARERLLSSLELDQLDRLVHKIKTERTWPTSL